MRLNAVFALLAFLVGAGTPAAAAQQFGTEQQAAQHCPSDQVVWVNTQSGVYHFAGERYYGRTKQGAFVCRAEADQSGYRATRNGQ
jgi:hypothetical protein